MPATKKHTQHAPSTETECGYLYGLIKRKKVTYANIWPRMVKPRDIAGDALEEEEEEEARFLNSSRNSQWKIGKLLQRLPLPGAWCYRASAWTGWPGVGMLWLGEIASKIRNFCLSVAALTLVSAVLSLRYTLHTPETQSKQENRKRSPPRTSREVRNCRAQYRMNTQ